MRINLNGHPIGLEQGRTLSFTARAGARIKVVRGDVWLTQDDDPNDYLLAAGEQLVVDRARPVIIQAESDAAIAIFEPNDRRSRWIRLQSWLAHWSVGAGPARSA